MHHSDSLSAMALAYIDRKNSGLEIAPYFDPFLRKPDFNVRYTDYIDSAAIHAKAADNPSLDERHIPDVDFVWRPDLPLKACAPQGAMFDYAVASHVMEHIADPIGWLLQILDTLRDGGHVVLFLPDKRRSSDYFRTETAYWQLVQWWIEQPSVPTCGQILDFTTNAFALTHDIQVDWENVPQISHFDLPYSDDEAINLALHAHVHRTYFDVHCTVWTPESFRTVMDRLIASGILNVDIALVAEDGAEFLAVLKKRGAPIRPLAFVENILREKNLRSTVEIARYVHEMEDQHKRLEARIRELQRPPILKFKFWLTDLLERHAPFLIPPTLRARLQEQAKLGE